MHIYGLVQDYSISYALAMEILQSCTEPLICILCFLKRISNCVQGLKRLYISEKKQYLHDNILCQQNEYFLGGCPSSKFKLIKICMVRLLQKYVNLIVGCCLTFLIFVLCITVLSYFVSKINTIWLKDSIFLWLNSKPHVKITHQHCFAKPGMPTMETCFPFI